MTQAIPCGLGLSMDLPPDRDWSRLHNFLKRAEELPYDSLWVSESILGSSEVLEPVSFMAYMAAITRRLRLGVAVILLTQRNPVQLAKSLASLDVLSGGRLDVGVGIGHGQEARFGYSPERRVRRFNEMLAVMRGLWTEPEFDFEGVFWQFEKMKMSPRPVQKPHPPIWFGARHPNAVKRAVMLGEGFVGPGSSSVQDFKTSAGLLQRYLQEADRDPASFGISKRVYIAIEPDHKLAEEKLRTWFGKRYGNAGMATRVAVYGSKDECLDKLHELIRAGAGHLILEPVYSHEQHLEILAEEIMPALSA